ncbi:MAG: hydrogenase nickel incorporation protein HypB, partial [Chloroflexi bacterium]|nr:hydrogenase nickel incorporation protein HypB [Chloroflexota bacterium]
EHFDLDSVQMLMIENVGNLVCPASFDLGEDFKVSLLSVTEGEDKPLKYPQMFRASEIMLINKIDLLPHLRFDIAKCREYAEQVHPGIRIFEISCYSDEGLDQWYAWLKEQVAGKKF